MSLINNFRNALLAASLLAASLNAQAQTAVWKGPASGGEWNTDANWDLLLTPGATTNAFITANTNVSYNFPMTAATFGTVTTRGTLNINTNGFNSTGIILTGVGGTGKLFINTGAVVTVTGNVGATSNNVISMAAGSTVNITGALYVGSGSGGGSGSGTVGSSAFVTNNGATLNALSTGLNIANASVGTSALFVINGGTNNLGNVSVSRGSGGNGAPPTIGTDGLVINNGVVTMTNYATASNSHQTMDVTGGLVTNLGSFKLNQPTSQRTARFVQSGGLFVNPSANIISLLPTASGAIALYQVTGGTNMVAGFQFGDAVPSAGTTTLTVGAPIFVGAGGMASNGAVTLTASLNANGRLAASTDWTNGVTITLNGGVIDAQDVGGAAHNIYSTGVLKTGALIKNGGGTLTLTATNTPSSTTVNAGTLAFAIDGTGSAGSVGNSITVVSNATLDVSGLNSLNGFTLASGRTLSGGGTITGNFIAGGSSIINPAGTSIQGGMSFATGLAATNANFNFELTDDPTGVIKRNDAISITGDLNTGGVNPIAVTAVGSLGIGTYTLIHFTGAFNGDVSNFSCSAGAITNPPGSGNINLVVTSVRPVASLVWRGDGAGNQWDTAITADWLNGVALDRSYTGDTNTFNDTATNFTVNIFGNVTPASASTVLVNATNDYTFTGSGSIAGTTSLTKTNSGKLTLVGTNLFSGGVNMKGGTVSVASLADDGTPSPLGQTGTLLVDGGALEYSGPNYTWTRTLTLGSSGGTVSPVNTLTHIGAIAGTGPLIVSAVGGLTIGGANAYSGGTVLNVGTLTLTNVTGAGSGNITLNGGNLAIGAIKPANIINVASHSAQITGGNSGGTAGIKNVIGSSNLLLVVSGGSTFDLTGDMTAYSGTLTLSNGGGAFVRFNGSIGSSLATWNLGSGTMEINIRSSSTSNNIGALVGGSSTTLAGRGGSGNNGSSTYYIGANNLSTTFDGIIKDGSPPSGTSPLAINKVGSGTQTLSGVNTYSGSTTVSAGTLALTGSGSIASSTIDIKSGAFVDVSGLTTPTLALGGSQTLKGNGTVKGSLDASGTVSPGASIGTLTVTNIATLLGTTYMELNRTNGAQTNDILTATAGIVLGGTLTVTNVGPNLVAGDRFVLFNGPVSGTFGTVNLPENLGSVTYTWTNKTDIDGSIQVLTVVTVNTTPTNLVTSVSGNTLTLSWPADHTGWRLQAQTNDLSTG
ncbi:MAG: hypothetical protein RL616_517, partial [Verrucomicrobiota bacterium]